VTPSTASSGPTPPRAARGGEAEVRAFVPSLGVGEDPVTGSLNAGLAQWLARSWQPASYVASQGTVFGRVGRVHSNLQDEQVSVGGDKHTIVDRASPCVLFALRDGPRAPSVAGFLGREGFPCLRL
jgi:predicted PhzF superfamily epimerase YddE/YHI9